MKQWMFCILLLQSAWATADALSDRLEGFSTQKELRGSFVDTWHSVYLNEPIVSKGKLSYRAPGQFRKLVEYPELVEQIIKANRLYISRDGETEIVQLSSQKSLAAGIHALRDVLDGNESSLREVFKTDYHETAVGWQLELTPKAEQVAEQIVFQGKENRIHRVRINYQNGDHLITEILNDI